MASFVFCTCYDMGYVSLYLRLRSSGVSTQPPLAVKEQGTYIPKLGIARLSQINKMITGICWPGEPNCQCYDQFAQALPKGLSSLVIPLEVWGYPRNFLFTLRSLLMGRYDPAAAAPVL